jgi:hypothetical protein
LKDETVSFATHKKQKILPRLSLSDGFHHFHIVGLAPRVHRKECIPKRSEKKVDPSQQWLLVRRHGPIGMVWQKHIESLHYPHGMISFDLRFDMCEG